MKQYPSLDEVTMGDVFDSLDDLVAHKMPVSWKVLQTKFNFDNDDAYKFFSAWRTTTQSTKE